MFTIFYEISQRKRKNCPKIWKVTKIEKQKREKEGEGRVKGGGRGERKKERIFRKPEVGAT